LVSRRINIEGRRLAHRFVVHVRHVETTEGIEQALIAVPRFVGSSGS
jgi:hypothetical protein